MVQPKTFINRKVKKLQNEVDKLNKDGNIFNNLHSIPEITDTQKIKQHFTKTVTTKQCKEALNRLEIWVAKVKKSKKEEIIRENILKKAARKRFRAVREKQLLSNRPILNLQDTIQK